MERTSYLNEKYNNVNSNIVEAINLFDTVIETNKKIREKCEKYLRTMLEIKGGEIAMTGDQGEVVSVTYDGGTHPEYASNAYSIVNCVYLKDKDIYLSTEDSDEYPLENIDTDEVYTLATFIYEVLEHNERPSEDSANKVMKAVNIKWATDGEDVQLPSEMEIPTGMDEEEITDYLSDETGWLVESYDLVTE